MPTHCLPQPANDPEDGEEFFNSKAYLTVSGQLHAEAVAWYVLCIMDMRGEACFVKGSVFVFRGGAMK